MVKSTPAFQENHIRSLNTGSINMQCTVKENLWLNNIQLLPSFEENIDSYLLVGFSSH